MTEADQEHMWRRGGRLIMRSLRAHPVPHSIAMFGALLYVFAAVGGAWVLRGVTDDLIVPAFDDGVLDGGDVWVAVGFLVGVSILRGASIVTRRLFLSMAEYRTQRDWRRALLRHYLDVPLRFHRSTPTGQLLAHADIDLMQATMVLKPLAFSVSVVLLVIVAMISLVSIHWILALIAVVLFPTLVILSQIYTAAVEAPAALAQQRVGEVSAVAHESFDGALVVKTLGRQADEVERMRGASDRLRQTRIHVGRLRANFEPAIDALPNFGIVTLILTGTWLISRGDVTPGDIVLAATLFGLLTTPLRVFGFFLEEMPRSVVSLERVDGVMAYPTERRDGYDSLPDGPLDVVVDGLTVRYGDHNVLDDVSFEIAAGETVAVVGATGSGKSTLMESIVGLLDRERGSVALGGVDVEAASPEDLAARAAIVFQEAFLFAEPVSENVSMGRADAAAVDAALSVARAEEFVAALPAGSATVVGERGQTLSGGQRQRVALARALARRPRLLLLDDATSAVDPVVEAEILANLRRELETTLLIVAHRLSTIRLADRIVYLDEGRVVAVDTHDRLLQREDYRSLVTAYEADGT
ncbi:MAG: ABC transporter ATP-binding protein [Acidimicrobiales bacterium]|nr:ABC transporter ATP-binding protein [Acidimicrobiales bacterium]